MIFPHRFGSKTLKSFAVRNIILKNSPAIWSYAYHNGIALFHLESVFSSGISSSAARDPWTWNTTTCQTRDKPDHGVWKLEVLNLEESSCRLFFFGIFCCLWGMRSSLLVKKCVPMHFLEGPFLLFFFVGENKWRNLMAWNVMKFVLVLMLYLYTVVGLFAD